MAAVDSNKAILVFSAIALAGIGIASLVECSAKVNSNRDIIDTEKGFNVAIDYAYDGVSVVIVDDYSDYTGITAEYVTQDGLQVLTGINNVELMKAQNFDEALKRATVLSGNDENQKILSYDQIRSLNTEISPDFWNKNIWNLNYNFDYAIVETDKGVIVTNISTWKDWEDDDKVQYTDKSGNVYLSTYDNVRLVNSLGASKEAVYDYALTLAGSEDRLFGDIDKENDVARVRN